MSESLDFGLQLFQLVTPHRKVCQFGPQRYDRGEEFLSLATEVRYLSIELLEFRLEPIPLVPQFPHLVTEFRSFASGLASLSHGKLGGLLCELSGFGTISVGR